MSQASVEQALGRMVIDRQFRQAVKADPKKALAGLGLEAGEIDGFTHVDHNDFDESVTGLDSRISKGLSFNHNQTLVGREALRD